MVMAKKIVFEISADSDSVPSKHEKISVWRTIHDFHVLRFIFKIIFEVNISIETACFFGLNHSTVVSNVYHLMLPHSIFTDDGSRWHCRNAVSYTHLCNVTGVGYMTETIVHGCFSALSSRRSLIGHKTLAPAPTRYI